jgi:hypothetical protein
MRWRKESCPRSKPDKGTSAFSGNVNMRMGMRRFTRLTNAFSKRLDHYCHALSLYFMFYNFCRIDKTLKVTSRP